MIRLPMPTSAQGIPAGSISYSIDYTFKNDTTGKKYARAGTIVVAADADTADIQVSDDYNYAGSDTSSLYGVNADNALAFNIDAKFIDETGATYVTNSTPPYGILLSYTNTGFSLDGQFVYSYKAVV
jgi:hypothetical protein